MRRLLINITGIVQGVGFRPAVYRYACDNELTGWVNNNTSGVTLEIQGSDAALTRFMDQLRFAPPPLARINTFTQTEIPVKKESGFVITESQSEGPSVTEIPPDTSICPECQKEMNDPSDRRYLYPFINCTHCGPRYTIVEDLPYDRPLTTMKIFPLCPDCKSEYEDPGNRRFHAQPVSCPNCGPHLALWDSTATPVDVDNVIAATVDRLKAGQVMAIKGLGGYHLVVDARNESAVSLLRKRKQRPDKPLAVMVRDIETLKQYAVISDSEAAWLSSPQAPIVLVKQTLSNTDLAPSLVIENDRLGVMLPYTPLHQLLMKSFPVLVMTSANLSEEPLVSTEQEVTESLLNLIDGALVHDRPIAHKCDDSILKFMAGGPVMIRRARGFVPLPLPLPTGGNCILAAGGELKSTFGLNRNNTAYLSPHLGDLENYATVQNYQYELTRWQHLLELEPTAVVHDLHPDYQSTRIAQQLGLPILEPVQHHHAHAAAVMAEYGLSGPVLALCWDGTGFGTDNHIWGGEGLVADLSGFERLAHFEYMPLPGGDVATKEPWRLALSALWQATEGNPEQAHWDRSNLIPETKKDFILQMLTRKINCPLSSGLGRVFDVVYGLIAHTQQVFFEGRSGMALESWAVRSRTEICYSYKLTDDGIISLQPLYLALIEDLRNKVRVEDISRKFHNTLGEIALAVSRYLRNLRGDYPVVISGGCFQNALLTELVVNKLESNGFTVYGSRQVPPNDGCIAYGQLAIALSR